MMSEGAAEPEYIVAVFKICSMSADDNDDGRMLGRLSFCGGGGSIRESLEGSSAGGNGVTIGTGMEDRGSLFAMLASRSTTD